MCADRFDGCVVVFLCTSRVVVLCGGGEARLLNERQRQFEKIKELPLFLGEERWRFDEHVYDGCKFLRAFWYVTLHILHPQKT